MKQELEQLLLASLAKLTGSMLAEMPAASAVVVERTRDSQHGEFATKRDGFESAQIAEAWLLTKAHPTFLALIQ